MNPLVILLMVASFTSGMVWMKADKIYDFFLKPDIETVEERKDNDQRIILVPASQPLQPSVQPKPDGIKEQRKRPKEHLFCTVTTGPLGDSPLHVQGS